MSADIKTVHVPYCFHPDPIGGTEVYVQNLARHLRDRNVQVVVAAPGEHDAVYVHDRLPVRRFAVGQAHDLRDLYGAGDSIAAAAFGSILDDEVPDLVHLHAFTRGVSLRLVREAKRRDLPVVFTYHTPTVSCQRGTLLRWGSEVCDGVLDLHRCAQCTLHGLGMSKFASWAVGNLPPQAGRLAGHADLAGGVWTALRMTELVQLRQAAFRALMDEVDHIVVLCRWTEELLLHNGIPTDKITVSRHGLAQSFVEDIQRVEAVPLDQVPLRIAFLGRLDPTKGPDILIRALRASPELPVELHLYGIAQGTAGTVYQRQLESLAGGDPRISFLPPVASDQVIPLLRRYHLLAVPSRILETGPLVVLEAFAASVPVLGSNLGGVGELVEHDVNGLLTQPDSPQAWAQALSRLAGDRRLLARLKTGILPPRGMGQVTEELLMLYESILGTNVARQEPVLSG
jgi:glycosyltransferase involved in cell wall biosynthesis